MRRNAMEKAANIGGEANWPPSPLSVLAAGKAGRSSVVALVTALVAGMLVIGAAPSSAASVTAASFTASYAKLGQTLTLNVETDSTTKCVRVTDGTTTVDKDSNSFQRSWTFTSADSAALFTAGSGDGVKIVTATAYRNSNAQHKCTANVGESFGTKTASYVLDNTGPTVTGALAPAPNAAGWNKSDVTINWTANDGSGSGVGSGPTPATDSVTTSTPEAGVTKTATAIDKVGNTGNGSVTVRLDETVPTINGSRSPAANALGWNNTDVTASFRCSDALSGLKSCSAPTTLSANGAGQSVTGTAVDNADNTNTAPVSDINIDKAAPALSGAPAGAPNGAGWYKNDVTVNWSCSDALSGVNATCPFATTIASEGSNLTKSQSVSDKAGNTATATSSPAVQIDKTAPETTASAPTNWNNVNVTVSLNASDALSGVKTTNFILDGGAPQTGTSVAISAEGVHTLEYWSVDNADNAEAHRTVEVKIDKTPPTINHTQSPAPNSNGWNNSDVTVTFTCSDGTGSGITSCGPSRTVTTEGRDQAVTGTAVDNAGNSATDPATVSIDKTKPTITASRDRAPNASGWYNDDVRVSFECGDSLSGIDTCPTAPVTLGEGANQSASGTAADAAGNSATATERGINVDKTAPILTGAATTSPNVNGWYSGDVTIHWTAGDALSGLAGSAPGDDVLTGEGDNVCATKTVTDLAGNSTTKSACVKIDRHAPNTSASVPAPLASGWYATAVPVTLTGVDLLSAVETTYYSVDGGPAQVYSGVFEFGTKGIHTIAFWSVDKADNVEDKAAGDHTITLKIDGVPPTITGSRTPAANGFGWNNVPVAVNFTCSDAESGIAGCTGEQTLSNEGAGQSVTGTATDNAGNDASTTVGDINIDLTQPTLTGAPTTDANGAGWYRDNVVIQWAPSDALSGIDPATAPANSPLTGEGSNLGAGPVTVSDKAGNASLPASVSGIRIDRGAPAITAAKPPANAAGWYSGDVVIGFNCSDPNLADGAAGSGVASCPSDQLVTGNGANQSVTSDPAGDLAGNTTAGIPVGGINIDGLPPQSSANNVCTSKNGWCRGEKATVTISAADQAGLSGVKEIHYIVNSNAEIVSKGSDPVTVTVPLNGSGVANVKYWAVDLADNAESQNGIALKYDNIAPTVTHTVTPAPNADEWNNSDVTVRFTATDDDAGSGVEPGSVTPDRVISVETPVTGEVVNGQASDVAGNIGTDSVTIRLDKTPPTITGAITTGTLGTNGWYTGPVTVSFTCGDTLSGVGTCPDPVTVTTNGASQSVTRTAYDKAGNSAAANVAGINIDAEKPAITIQGVANGGSYTLGAVPSASCTATDSFSGVASCTVSVTGGLANGVGTFNYTATATDNAGNVQTLTGSYRVVYRSFDGFLQPINDTAHQTGTAVSVFKAGSTVPVKFQLRKADGTIVQANTAPQWLTPAKGSMTTAPVDESVYSEVATAGTSYRWDATAQQYIYNWGSPKNGAGYYWRIGVKLDDGNTHTVNIGLR